MRNLRRLSLLAITVLLTSCVGAGVQQLNNTDVNGSSFTQNLARGYRDYANFLANQMVNWRAAEYFSRKGISAARGELVEPETLENWGERTDVTQSMIDGRNRLVASFNAGARERRPDIAAQAQVKFDCWVERNSLNTRSDHSAVCRNEFFTALALLDESAQTGTPTYLVFFEFGQSGISRDGQRVIDSVIRNRLQSGRIDIIGHTDTVGSAAYNQVLSERRAIAVRQALVKAGIPSGLISTSGVGFQQPLVPTPPNIREQSNRCVVIRLL
jgi:OOP family OmpA-OmpF porin